jgi:predicted aspartyl protease
MKVFCFFSSEKKTFLFCFFEAPLHPSVILPTLALLLPLLAAGCAADNAAPGQCKLGHLTDLPLLRSNIMLTPASLDDRPATMMLDTGGAVTIITKRAADRLRLAMQDTGRSISGVGGAQTLYAVQAGSFRIGQLHGTDLMLGASDIGIGPHDSEIDGIFGADFLSDYDVDFDLPEGKLRLFKVFSGCDTPSAHLDGPLYLAPFEASTFPDDKRPHVRVVIDGVPLDAIVDSGAQRSAIYRDAARRIGLRLEDLTTDRHYHAIGVGSEARDEVRHIMAPIRIGEVTIAHLPVGIIDQHSTDGVDMLLGLDFFTHVHVWLAFHARTLIMQYPPRPSPRLPEE